MTAMERTASPLGLAWKKIDKAWALSGLVVLTLAIADRAQAAASLEFAAGAYVHILPYLALAIGLSAYAKGSSADQLIAKAFQGNVALMVVFAALMGGLSPFCSCGVIPLIAALLAMGVPLAAVMAFWLASPIMDPSMFFITAGELGETFAVAKTIAAVSLGLFGGYGVMLMQRGGLFADPLREGVGNGGCGGSRIRNPKQVVWAFWTEEGRRHAFRQELLKSLLFLSKWLILAYLVESLMLAYVPQDLVVSAVGGAGLGPIILSTLIGVPAYLNGYAAVPVVAGLIDQGMTPGAAMAFLVAGGVSSVPAAIAVFALVKRPVFLAYLGFAFVGSVLAGLIFDMAM